MAEPEKLDPKMRALLTSFGQSAITIIDCAHMTREERDKFMHDVDAAISHPDAPECARHSIILFGKGQMPR